jgi:GTP cyclohydrolase II
MTATLTSPFKLQAIPEVLELSRAQLPTTAGLFEIVAYAAGGVQMQDIALVKGPVTEAAVVPVRVHSECLTGDVLGSLRCDCGQQLELAMQRLAGSSCGILLYLRQEGRGIGIANKVRAYALQDGGLDTVDANLHLGFDDDLRRYDTAAAMLHALGVTVVDLHTNNPRKVEGLRAAGIDVRSRVPLAIAATEQNRFYLTTKRRRSGHLIDES